MDNLPSEMFYQVLAQSFQNEGAIEFFRKNLPLEVVNEYGKGHGEIYRALCTFYDKTGVEVVDKVSFSQWLQSETRIMEAIGGEEGLNEYIEIASSVELSTPRATTALMRHYLNNARKEERIRELNTLLEDDGSDKEEKINELARQIQDLNRSEADPLASVHDGLSIAERADGLWDLPDFIATPFKDLNKAMGYDENAGFCKGAVHAILAQSGAGKSTLAKCLMNYWVDQGYTCMFVNYEEAIAHWERVLFTQITGKNVYQSNGVTDIDRKHYTQIFRDKMHNWNGRFLVKHDPETPYFEDMESWVREVAAKGKAPDVLFIDTIQSMFLKGGKSLPRWGQYEEMMVRLEKLAKDIGCAIVITAQENTNRMKEKREVVQQSDIGGSIAIAQKCSIAIFITRAKLQMSDDSMDETIMQLQIPKNRITGVTSMMDPPLVKYNDDTKSYEDFSLPAIEAYGDALSALEDLANLV